MLLQNSKGNNPSVGALNECGFRRHNTQPVFHRILEMVRDNTKVATEC